MASLNHYFEACHLLFELRRDLELERRLIILSRRIRTNFSITTHGAKIVDMISFHSSLLYHAWLGMRAISHACNVGREKILFGHRFFAVGKEAASL